MSITPAYPGCQQMRNIVGKVYTPAKIAYPWDFLSLWDQTPRYFFLSSPINEVPPP